MIIESINMLTDRLLEKKKREELKIISKMREGKGDRWS